MTSTADRSMGPAVSGGGHRAPGPVAGLAGSVLMLAALGLYVASRPPLGAPAGDIAAFYQSSGRGLLVGLSWVAINVAGIAVLFFLAGLCSALRGVLSTSERLPSVVLAAGSVALALLWISFSIIDGLPGALRFDKHAAYDARLDPHLHAVLDTVTYDTRSQACVAAAVMIGAAAFAAGRASLLPRWFVVVSKVIAVMLFFASAVGTVTLVLLPVWIATTSLLIRAPAQPWPAR